MAYASPMKIANGLVLDFTVDNADTANDTFLGLNSSGEVTKFATVPRSRVSGGGNITESTSSVLTITGGTGAALTSGLTIQVLQAGAAQSGYLSTTDWNTFNNKLSSSLTSAYIYVGNGSNVATGVAMSGDISITNTGNAQIVAGAIIDADVNASAAIAFSKMASLTASRILASNGSGIVSILDTATYPSLTELSYVKGVASAIQTQLNNRLSVTLSSPTNGDVITYNGAAWVNSPSGTGVPTGGTTAQILRKASNTPYDTEWHTLLAADLTDVSSTAAELNKLSGVTTTATQFNFLNTLSADVQAQLAAKVGTSLTQNYMFVGDASNVVSTLAPGTNGYVLTSVSGVPTWVSPGVGGTVTSVAASGGTTGMSFTGSPITTTGTLTLTGTLALANGGTGAALVDPGADRIMFWDDSAGAVTWLTAGNGTTITTTTLSAGGTLSADVTFSADGLAHDFIYTSLGPGSTGSFNVYVSSGQLINLSGNTTIDGLLQTDTSGTSSAGLNIPHGTAPSAPNNGDFWSTASGFYGRVNGTTVGPFGTGFTLTNGSGTTANGTAVDLGGTLTANTTVQLGSTLNSKLRFQTDGSDEVSVDMLSTNGSSSAQVVSQNSFTTPMAFMQATSSPNTAYVGVSSNGFVINITGTDILAIDMSKNVSLNLGSDTTGDTYQRDPFGYFSRLAAVSAGSFLRSGGVATVNAWSTVKLPDTMSALGLWVANSANTTVNLTATAGQSIRVNAGGTAWEAYTPSGSGTIGGSTGSVDNSILRSDGTGGVTLQASSLFIDDSANLTLGTASLSGSRQISVSSSTADANLTLLSQGSGTVKINNNVDFRLATASAAFADTYTLIGLGSFTMRAISSLTIGGTGSTSGTPPDVNVIGNQAGGTATIGGAVKIRGGLSGITAVKGGDVFLIGGDASVGNADSGDVYISSPYNFGTGKKGNLGISTLSVSDWQDMELGVYIGNRVTAPTAGLADGIALFAEDVNSSSELFVYTESGAKVNISGLLTPVTESGTTVTLTEAHRGRMVLCTNSGVVTVTVGTALPDGWNCILLATHATGTIVLSAGGATLNGTTSTTAQFESLTLVNYGTDTYICKLG